MAAGAGPSLHAQSADGLQAGYERGVRRRA